LSAAFSAVSVWFVHHPRRWIERKCSEYPEFVTAPLLSVGNAVGDITDGLGWTGHDAIYEYDVEAPVGSVLFAGAPKRTGSPAPNDIVMLDRGEFIVGWSPRLRHPVWCAYHVAKEPRYEIGTRPNFSRDREVPTAPTPSDYEHSGYDRGHMAPNYAIKTRYGSDDQRQTFLMSNIAPQKPALNRGVWKDVEHRIAQLWTARYGEIWVIVGCISSPESRETVSGTDVDVPQQFYQIVVAQEGMDVRALAVLFPQSVPYGAYAARHLISIDELEQLSGLDFLPELPEFIQSPLESELPSRLWPIRWQDILQQIAVRLSEGD
jgi:endonuclease G